MPRNRKKGGNPIIEEKQNQRFGSSKSEPSWRRITMKQELENHVKLLHMRRTISFCGKGQQNRPTSHNMMSSIFLQGANKAVLF